LPILLDADNQYRLDDPLYIGRRHPSIHGKDYDDFLDVFVEVVHNVKPPSC